MFVFELIRGKREALEFVSRALLFCLHSYLVEGGIFASLTGTSRSTAVLTQGICLEALGRGGGAVTKAVMLLFTGILPFTFTPQRQSLVNTASPPTAEVQQAEAAREENNPILHQLLWVSFPSSSKTRQRS